MFEHGISLICVLLMSSVTVSVSQVKSSQVK